MQHWSGTAHEPAADLPPLIAHRRLRRRAIHRLAGGTAASLVHRVSFLEILPRLRVKRRQSQAASVEGIV